MNIVEFIVLAIGEYLIVEKKSSKIKIVSKMLYKESQISIW